MCAIALSDKRLKCNLERTAENDHWILVRHILHEYDIQCVWIKHLDKFNWSRNREKRDIEIENAIEIEKFYIYFVKLIDRHIP